MYPDRDTLSNVPRSPCSGYITARDQSMVESGMTEGGKTLPVFFFVNEHNNTNMKPQAKKQQFSKLSQMRNNNSVMEEKDTDKSVSGFPSSPGTSGLSGKQH